jgi:hypothetical protein
MEEITEELPGLAERVCAVDIGGHVRLRAT